MGGITGTADAVRSATPADVDALVAFGQNAMQGAWRCALQGPASPAKVDLQNYLAESDRFDVIVGLRSGVPVGFAVMELANHQMRWFVASQADIGGGASVMIEAKRKYPNLWGIVENPTVRAAVANVLSTMKVTGQRIDT